MDENAINAIEIHIPCPKCLQKSKHSIGWLRANGNFVCSCGYTHEIDQKVLINTVEQLRDMPEGSVIDPFGKRS